MLLHNHVINQLFSSLLHPFCLILITKVDSNSAATGLAIYIWASPEQIELNSSQIKKNQK